MKNLLKFTLCIFVFSLMFTACTKQDSDIIEEEQEVIENLEPSFRYTVNGRTVNSEAFATYCNVDGKQVVRVANKEVLLGDELFAQDFEVDDFLLFHVSVDEEESSIGGAGFADEFDGQPITSIILDANTEVVIDSADEEFVIGSLSGTFELLDGSTADYSVEFTAEVVEISNDCE